MLTREEGNKIEVDEDTVVAHAEDVTIHAEDLQQWAYRRLITWPDLLKVCEWVSMGEHHSACPHCKDYHKCECQVGAAKEAIALAK